MFLAVVALNYSLSLLLCISCDLWLEIGGSPLSQRRQTTIAKLYTTH